LCRLAAFADNFGNALFQ